MERVVIHFAVILCLSALLFHSAVSKQLKSTNEENCEVCVKFLTKFVDSLDSDVKSSEKAIEEEFKVQCKDTKKDDNRFCYYVGGLVESATGMVNDLAKPISWGMPADKVCMKLYKKDQQICDLKYDKEIDLSAVDLKKLKVKELKKILSNWEETCRGCTEKSEYVSLVEELMPKHAPESASKRAKTEL